MAGVVHIPWYATGFRPTSSRPRWPASPRSPLRYGARSYQVHRFRDDRYKFLQTAEFDDKLDFERYWHGPEFIDFRVLALELVPGAGRSTAGPTSSSRARSSPRRPASRRPAASAGDPAGDAVASGDPRLALGRALDVHPHAGQRLADEA